MAKSSIIERIQSFNKGRHPALLARKYKALQTDPFVFLRGTCHVFYEDWPRDSPLNDAPPVWISGDLHLENFGAYKADNRVVHFDINDFDEALLAPCTWELTRFVTSVLVAARSLSLTEDQALTLSAAYLNAYAAELEKGHCRTLYQADATGMVKDLLTSLKKRDRAAFLDKRTIVKKGRRRFVVDDVRTMAISSHERERVETFFRGWSRAQPHQAFYKLLDVAHRIAGTGSLGVTRYALLVEGRGSPDGNFLLDLKAMPSPSAGPYTPCPQPAWANDAERAVAIQRRMQGTPPALLQALMLDGQPFVLKEMQPTQDRVALDGWNGKLRRLERVVEIMGRITAWDQLRSGGRQGSAITDTLIAFAQEPTWKAQVIDQARAYSAKTEADYQELRAAKLTPSLSP